MSQVVDQHILDAQIFGKCQRTLIARRNLPFPLEETTHIFTETKSGGRQDVVADEPMDQTTIDEIRAHLAEEAGKFRSGDFSDPEAIHGAAMPGLAALKTGFDQIDVQLIETSDGAPCRGVKRWTL